MLDREPASDFSVGMAIGLLLGVAVVIGIWLTDLPQSCPAQEDFVTCVREWLGIVAGGATAVVGLFAALAVYLTIPPMRQQLEQLKRQTTYIVGDELPSLEIWPNRSGQFYRFRIINWNRRVFLITKVEWDCPSNYPAGRSLYGVSRGGEVRALSFIWRDGRVEPGIPVENYLNRSDQPPELWCHQPAEEGVAQPEYHSKATLRVTGYLVGNRHEQITLEAHVESLQPDL